MNIHDKAAAAAAETAAKATLARAQFLASNDDTSRRIERLLAKLGAK